MMFQKNYLRENLDMNMIKTIQKSVSQIYKENENFVK